MLQDVHGFAISCWTAQNTMHDVEKISETRSDRAKDAGPNRITTMLKSVVISMILVMLLTSYSILFSRCCCYDLFNRNLALVVIVTRHHL